VAEPRRWLSLGATVVAVVYAVRHYELRVQIATIAIAPIVFGILIKLRFRGRSSTPGPIALMTFFVGKGFVIALALTPALLAMRNELRPRLVAEPLIGAAFALGAGLCLAVPIALSLLAYWPGGRAEARDWEHLRRA
jgi:hypothetical protein